MDRLIALDSMGGGTWPFSVGGVICLVDSVDERDLSLFKSAKHDSHLITPQRDFVSNALKLEATTGKPRLPAFTCEHMMRHQRRRTASLRINYAECPLLSGSAGIIWDKFPRCPFAPRRIKKMSVGPRPNEPECPFVRGLSFETSGGEEG